MKPGNTRILNIYILKELSGSFFFGVMAFTLILVAGDLLFDLADLIIEKGVSLFVVLRLFLYRLPAVVTLTLPMACLLSTLLSFGRLSSNSELIALRASGVAFQRILKPVMVAALMIGAFALLFNETIVPLANKAAMNIMRYEVAREKPSLLQERVFLREESEGTLSRVIYINRLEPREGRMEEVLIQEFEKGRLRRITTSREGEWVEGYWILSDGEVFEVDNKGAVSLLFRFQEQKTRLDLTPREISRASTDPEDMSIFELYDHIALLEKQGMKTGPLWVIFHLRIAIPWASIVLAIVGASLGVRPQRSGPGVGFGLSIIIVFAYYVVMSFCKSLGQSGFLLPVISAWIPNVVFLGFGSFLARRVNH